MKNKNYTDQTQVINFIEFEKYFETIKDYDYLKAKFVKEMKDNKDGKKYKVINNPFVLEYIYKIMIDEYEIGYPGPGPDTYVPKFEFELEDIIINTMLNFDNFNLFLESNIIPEERYYRYINLIKYGRQYLKFWNEKWYGVEPRESYYTMRFPNTYLFMEYFKNLKYNDKIKVDFSYSDNKNQEECIIESVMTYFLRNMNNYTLYHCDIDNPEEFIFSLEGIRYNSSKPNIFKSSLIKDDLYNDYLFYINLPRKDFKNRDILISLFERLDDSGLDKLKNIFLDLSPMYIKDTKKDVLSDYIYDLMERISNLSLDVNSQHYVSIDYIEDTKPVVDRLIDTIDNL